MLKKEETSVIIITNDCWNKQDDDTKNTKYNILQTRNLNLLKHTKFQTKQHTIQIGQTPKQSI